MLSITLCDFIVRLPDSGQRGLFPQHFQRFKQRRRVLAAAHGDADGLKHLSGLYAKFLSGGT